MERHFDLELEQLEQSLCEMAGRVEEMIANGDRALVERNDDVANAILVADREVDNLEMEIDHTALTLIARQEPKARDLRLLSAVMKIANDLERVGDSAVNIAKSAKKLNAEPRLKPYIDLPRMSRLTREMLRDSLDSLVKRDSDLARQVVVRDDEVDDLYHQLFRELASFMIEDPKTVTRSLELLLVARNLERIADHATNIAENAIYVVEGRDIRHTLAKGRPAPE